jgi:hypothetical protein
VLVELHGPHSKLMWGSCCLGCIGLSLSALSAGHCIIKQQTIRLAADLRHCCQSLS